jgi:hypothetical protein
MQRYLTAHLTTIVMVALAGCQTAGAPLAPPVVAAAPSSAPVRVGDISCSLQGDGTTYQGHCLIPCMVNALAVDIDGPNPKVQCNDAPRRVAATLAKTDREGAWLGTMEGKHPEDPTRLDVTLGRNGQAGVAKLPFGWFALTAAVPTSGALALTINAQKQLPPTQDDIKIIERAKALVSDARRWNRQDTRECPPQAPTVSVFCALMQATQEVAGGIHYRQPALQAAREVVAEVGGTRVGKHRLMDYNNHPDTTLDDIQQLLQKAQARVTTRFR